MMYFDDFVLVYVGDRFPCSRRRRCRDSVLYLRTEWIGASRKLVYL